MSNGGGGGGSGECYEEFKRLFKPSKESRVRICNRRCIVGDDLKEITYRYEYWVEILGSPTHDFWFHMIPLPKDEILHFRAWDAKGSLRSEFKSHGKVTEARVYYREKKGKNQKLTFEYKVPCEILSIPSILRKTYIFYDWISHTTDVDKLVVEMVFPKKIRIRSSRPSPNPSGRITFENLQAFSANSFHVVFEIPRITKEFIIIVLSIVASAVFGALLSKI